LSSRLLEQDPAALREDMRRRGARVEGIDRDATLKATADGLRRKACGYQAERRLAGFAGTGYADRMARSNLKAHVA
jgi:hypothetical protein